MGYVCNYSVYVRLSFITEGTLSSSRERINLYLHLCELLANFALQHSFRSHFYMLSSNIASHVATLLSARDKHLRLGTCNAPYNLIVLT